jgi:DNA-binding transcriptional LysR family regulator
LHLGLKPPRFKADNAYVLAEAAAADLGVVAMGEMIAGPYVEAGKLVPIMTRFRLPDVGIFVVRPPSQHIPRKVRLLIDLLVEKFATVSGDS